MTDPTPDMQDTEPETITEPETALSAEPVEEQSPWQKEGVEFDADKAWKLVQHLRDENKSLKDRNRAFEDEKLSEQEKAERDLEQARTELEQMRKEKTLAQIRARYSVITDEDLEFLGSGSPEELEQRAAKLAARLTPAEPAAGPEHVNPLRRIPKGGIDPTSKPKTDFIRDALASM